MVAATRHEEFAHSDYWRLQDSGIFTAREGARWHVIEDRPGHYDFCSLERIFDAAQDANAEIILDLMHFGWPDWLDVTRGEFSEAFTAFSAAVVEFLKTRTMDRIFLIPVNEISFLSWAAGDEALIHPHLRGMGGLVKRQLVKAAINASRMIRQELPAAMILSAEPVIHIVGRNHIPGDKMAAERHRLAMFEAWDMITGRSCPELGGEPGLMDVIGLNFYDRNQWINHERTLRRGEAAYRPFHKILAEVHERYQCPVFVSETGTEDEDRPNWLSYVSAEVRTALDMNIPVEGICLYPIVNHPGWDDDRHCMNGLWDYADDHGFRRQYLPLADALAREQEAFRRACDPVIAEAV